MKLRLFAAASPTVAVKLTIIQLGRRGLKRGATTLIRHTLLALLAVLGLTGCVSIRLSASHVLNTDAQLRREGATVTPGLPVELAMQGGTHRTTKEAVPVAYGAAPPTRVESDPAKPLIVFCGGNLFRQETRGASTIRALAPLGDVWLFDYPGYGGSPGAEDPKDFAALQDALSRRIDAAFGPGGRTGDLVFVGHSFGGGVCAGLASSVRTPSHLVLVGAFHAFASIVETRAGVFRPFVRPVIASDARTPTSSPP